MLLLCSTARFSSITHNDKLTNTAHGGGEGSMEQVPGHPFFCIRLNGFRLFFSHPTLLIVIPTEKGLQRLD